MSSKKLLRKVRKLRLDQINDDQTIFKTHPITSENWKEQLREGRAHYYYLQQGIWINEFVVLMNNGLYGLFINDGVKTTLFLFDDFVPEYNSLRQHLIVTKTFDFTSSEEDSWSDLEEPLTGY